MSQNFEGRILEVRSPNGELFDAFLDQHRIPEHDGEGNGGIHEGFDAFLVSFRQSFDLETPKAFGLEVLRFSGTIIKGVDLGQAERHDVHLSLYGVRNGLVVESDRFTENLAFEKGDFSEEDRPYVDHRLVVPLHAGVLAVYYSDQPRFQ